MTPRNVLTLPLVATAAIGMSAAIAQSAAKGEHTYTTALSGAAEVPGPGDTDGTGSAEVTVSVPKKEVCYKLTVANIETATMAHIHSGAVGAAGPIVVTLETPTGGSSQGCATVTGNLAAQLLARPQNYYVNVHNAPFPSGAVRGQLG